MSAVSGPLPNAESYDAIASRIATLLPSMSALYDISLGWADTLMFDSQYIEPKLKQKNIKKKPEIAVFEGADLPALGLSSAIDLLRTLEFDGPIAELAQLIHNLDVCAQAMVRRDDFWETPPELLCREIRESFSDKNFNVVIVGAGPVGTLLASGLKRELGDAIDVLLVESRIQAEHHKHEYSRRWLSNIPMKLFERLIHPRAAQACAKTGDGLYMGVDICSLETLALLSARQAGARCLFTSMDHSQWLEGSPVHLVVDASGSRWLTPAKAPEKTFRGVRLQHAAGRSNGYVNFGLLRAQEIPGNKIDVLQKDGWLYPLYRDKPIKQSLLKLTGIDPEVYPSLLQWVQLNNRDSKFYVWPGRKHEDINQLLILVNLSVKEHEALSKLIGEELALIDLFKWAGFKKTLDPRLQSLLQTLYSRIDHRDSVAVSRPFLVEPKMRDPDSATSYVKGIPVLPIGDSFFCGNPKSGNGLGVHLKHIQMIGHHLSAALKSI